jgi:hypothetical protein
MFRGLHVNRPLLFVTCVLNLNSGGAFSKNTEILNFMTIRSVGVELLHADRQTDGRTHGRADRHEEANSRF